MSRDRSCTATRHSHHSRALTTAVAAVVLGLLAAPVAVRAGLIPAPAQVLAMWNGKDGASVRRELRAIAASGDAKPATTGQRIDGGEAAYWLGVQDQRAGRPDSALAQFRRAVTLRGDFDDGFALIDLLAQRARPADLAEARELAATLAVQANTSDTKRVPEAHARLAWLLHKLGQSAEGAAELRDYAPALYRRPLWTRRFLEIQRAGGDDVAAWQAAVLLSARARRADASIESVLVELQHRLRFNDDRRTLSVSVILDRAVADEQAFVNGLHGQAEVVRMKDGFPLQVLTFPAHVSSARLAPVLMVAGADTLAAADSLIVALTSAGHPVALLSPRGTFGSVASTAWDADAWRGREHLFLATTTADAGAVMDALAKRPAFGGGRPWIVCAAGDRAPIALELARARRGTPALVLIAPRLPLVEIAEYRARLRALRVRTFVQISPEEPDALELSDLLARDTLPGQVRVADSGARGRGGAIFRADPKVARRLVDWLEERPGK